MAVLESWWRASCSNANRTEGRESMRTEGNAKSWVGVGGKRDANKIREPDTRCVPRVCMRRPAQKIRRTKLRRERNRNPCFVVSSPALWSGRMNGCIGDAANVGPVDGTEIAGSGKQESKQNADRHPTRRRSCLPWKRTDCAKTLGFVILTSTCHVLDSFDRNSSKRSSFLLRSSLQITCASFRILFLW